MIKIVTAGESHGRYLSGIIEGLPAGIKVDISFIEAELKRRRTGYGRSARQLTEKDNLIVTGGVINGRTTGAPVSILIENSDWKPQEGGKTDGFSSLTLPDKTRVVVPRPGHSDLVGYVKYRPDDLRIISERASARETVVRTALGCFARLFLKELSIETASHTVSIGDISIKSPYPVPWEKVAALPLDDPFRCSEKDTAALFKKEIDSAKDRGDTLGGSVELLIKGVPPGLGDCMVTGKRLSVRLAAAAFSIPSVKAFEIGGGFQICRLTGSTVTDALYPKSLPEFRGDVIRKTNYAGGIEGGISTGEIIRCTAHFKPVPTLGNPLDSVNLDTNEPAKAPAPRADICIVPSAGVIMESLGAIVIASSLMERYGGDNVEDIKHRLDLR